MTCTGGTPAGCAATGQAQPTFETCSATTQSCVSGSQGCVSGTTQNTLLGIVAIGQPVCPSGTTPRVDSMRITTTGTFEYGGGIDYYGNGASSSLRVMLSKTPSKCYQLIRPYIAVGNPNWAIRCANSQQCPYTITSTVVCVTRSSATPCLVGPLSTAAVSSFTIPDRPCAGNAGAITANDGNQYCCESTSNAPVFGQTGSCTCGQLRRHTSIAEAYVQVRLNYEQVLTFYSVALCYRVAHSGCTYRWRVVGMERVLCHRAGRAHRHARAPTRLRATVATRAQMRLLSAALPPLVHQR